MIFQSFVWRMMKSIQEPRHVMCTKLDIYIFTTQKSNECSICVVLCRSLVVLLSFFCWRLYCLSFFAFISSCYCGSCCSILIIYVVSCTSLFVLFPFFFDHWIVRARLPSVYIVDWWSISELVLRLFSSRFSVLTLLTLLIRRWSCLQ